MSIWIWILAGVISALLLFLGGASRFYSRRADWASNYLMTLLLDEFAYRKQRVEFIALVETLKVSDPNVLYRAAMLDIEDGAERAAKRAGAIGGRLWRINRDALRGVRYSDDAAPSQPGPAPAEPIGAFRGNMPEAEGPFPNSAENLALSETLIGVRKALRRIGKSLKKLLGIR